MVKVLHTLEMAALNLLRNIFMEIKKESRSIYYDNGNPKLETYYKNNLKDGVETGYFEKWQRN